MYTSAQLQPLFALVAAASSSADNTGCGPDLTVCSKSAVEGAASAALALALQSEGESPPSASPNARQLQDRFDALVDAAKHHGEDSDPDHEVGDLQDHLRAMWSILTPEMREHFLSRPDVADTYAAGAREI